MGIKPFNVANLSAARLIDPKEVGFQDSIDIISDELHKTRKSFIKIGWYLKHINETEMYKEHGYSNIYEVAHDKFNISQPTATRFMNLCEEFSVDHNSPELDEKYVEFNVSQLFEMLPMKQEEMDQVTPDMTVKQIREMKRETRTEKEPSDRDIRNFYQKCLGKLTVDERKNLKEYMIENYGKRYSGGGPNPNYDCRPRGIKINNSDEITWASFVKRVNELIPMQEEAKQEDMDIPGQTSIEKDFPEYMPENHSVSTEQNDNDQKYATSHKQKAEDLSEANIIDGKYREVSETLSAYGLPRTEYPEGSLLTTKGCGHKYDCFSCAQQCSIRQKERYCVDAPLGNPYNCTTMDSIKTMNKELFKEDCQFFNLDLAERTTGSDEPVPCCKNCQINATCFFCCDKAKELCHISEQESKEEAKALQKSETVVDGECRSISTEVILENEDEESLREEIEALADGVREVFWGWEGQPIPKGEVEVAKKNAIKLSFAIEKLLTIM